MSEWISVKDQLPPKGVPVLVWDSLGNTKTKGSIKQVSYNTNSQKKFCVKECKENYYLGPRYTHWMLLPESPKDQK